MNEDMARQMINFEQSLYEVLEHLNVLLGDGVKTMTKDGIPIRKLFVANLAKRTTYKDLRKLFSKYGTVESCYVQRNQGGNNYAFVTFSNVEDAAKAREDGYKRGINLHDRDLSVTSADSWHQPDSIDKQSYHFMMKVSNKIDKKLPSNEGCNIEDYTDTQIHTLNDDCLMHIFLYLPIIDRIRIERVCKRWRAVSQQSWCAVKCLDVCTYNWGSRIYTATLRKVLLRCGNFLNHVRFVDKFHCLTHSALTIVGKLCPNLQTIDVTVFQISPSGINSLTNNCKNIKKLSIGSSTYSCDNDLMKLFKANENLKSLKIVKNRISGKCLLYLPFCNIEELTLDCCINVQGIHLSNALTFLSNLKSLSIIKCVCVTSSVLEAIGTHCKSLKELELSGHFPLLSSDMSQGMLHIVQLPHLSVLKLGQNHHVTDDFLIAIASEYKYLTYLDINGCNEVTDRGLVAVATLPKLETLIISYIKQVTAEGLNKTYNLKRFECRECVSLTDAGISKLIEVSPDLELLDLSYCVGITEKTLDVAAQITSRRTNNTILKVFVPQSGVQPYSQHWLDRPCSPYLQILHVQP